MCTLCAWNHNPLIVRAEFIVHGADTHASIGEVDVEDITTCPPLTWLPSVSYAKTGTILNLILQQ